MGVAELDVILREAAEKKGWFDETAEKAEEKAKLEVAREMLDMGMTTDQITRATKLPFAAIKKLKMEI